MSTAKNAVRTARRSTAFRRIARAGYVVLGVVHVIIGLIAVSIASGTGGDADQDGAMEQLRRTPIGGLLLWTGAAGLVALAVWQMGAAVVRTDPDGVRRWGQRVRLIGTAAAYLVIAGMAVVYAVGGRADSEEATRGASAGALSAPGGVLLLALVGAGVVAVGAGFVFSGVTRAFTATMALPDGSARAGVVAFGVVGYVAKGIAVGVTGVLLVVAALTQDPQKASGLDGALHLLASHAAGRPLLWAVGAGLAVYGLFCMARARLARM